MRTYCKSKFTILDQKLKFSTSKLKLKKCNFDYKLKTTSIQFYQVDTVQLSKFVMTDGLKYLFTMVDQFIKYGWIILLKDKTTKNLLGTFKKWITTHNVLTTLQTDNEAEFKNSIMNQFWLERNIQHIFETPYNPKHLGAVEAFNRTDQDLLTLAKDHQNMIIVWTILYVTFYCIIMIDFIQP